MPSIDVKGEDSNSLGQKDGVDSSLEFTNQTGKTNPKKQIKMPCSPFDKCGATIPESLPPERSCSIPPLESNGIIHTSDPSKARALNDSMPTKTNMAVETAEKHPQENGETSCKDVQNAEDKNKEEGTTVTKSIKTKPRSFSLLEMTYNKDEEGKGHGRLVRQRSVKNSFEKETHVLTHAASAPAAISDILEPHLEDEVFGEDGDKKSNYQHPGRGDSSSKGLSDGEPSEKIAQDKNTEESQQKDKDSDSQNRKVESEGDKDRKENEMIEVAEEDRGRGRAETSQSNEEGDEEIAKKEAEQSALLDAGGEDREKSTCKKKEDTGDVEALTRSLQTGLQLGDSISKLEKDNSDFKEVEVSFLVDDLQQRLSLDEKTNKKPVIMTSEGSRISSTKHVPTRLRAKGVHKEEVMRQPGVIMNTDDVFVQQPQWLPSQQPSSPHWQMNQPQPQNQPLPSFQIFVRPQTKINTNGQPNQSVVSPPGQGNLTRMVFMGRSGPQMLKIGPVGGQSKQIQYAQQNLYYEKSSQQMQQNYPQNSLNNGGSSFQMSNQQQMNIPGESTGMPSEVDWPPTPESDRSEVEDILDIIEDDSEESMNELMNIQGGTCSLVDLVGVPSPQSSFGGSHAASISSVSPVPSPYTDHHSPFHQVPDINGPWSPDSNVGSSGDPASPDSSSFIQAPGIMSCGKVSIMSPNSPHKRKRNDSSISTDSQEAKEGITRIKMFLKQKPDASPSYWQPSQQNQHYSPSLTPPYTPSSAAPAMPIHSPPMPIHSPHALNRVPHAPIRTQQPPLCLHPQSPTPPEGELDAFRKHLAGWGMEELLAVDDDRDTVLHLAICQMKVALSLAIIERLWKLDKLSLNVTNKLHQTPLFLSVISNLPILTQILINYGADPTIGNEDGNTPLHVAAMNGNNDAIKAIWEGIFCYCGYSEETARELFDNRNFDGKTPLMLAIECHGNQSPDGDVIDCRETIQLLLKTCASSLCQDAKSGKTALHYAVELRKIDLILILLENCDDAGQLVNSQMYDGNTALHLIVGRALLENEILNIVNLLMTRGANVGLDNAAREKPLDLVHREHAEIKRRLHGQGNRKR